MTKRTRRMIDAALKARLRRPRFESGRGVADLAQRCEVRPNQIYACGGQLLEQASRAFEAESGEAAAGREHKIEKLHAKIGELIAEGDF